MTMPPLGLFVCVTAGVDLGKSHLTRQPAAELQLDPTLQDGA
jgi:hypothetical protein